MKRFLLRLLAVHPIATLVAVCLLPPATVWSWREAGQVGAPERAIHYEAAQTRAWLGGQIASVRADLFREVHEARADLLTRSERQIAAARQDTFAQVGQIRRDANVWMAESLDRVDRTLTIAEGLQTSVKPALDGLATTEASFTSLANRYAAVPDQVSAQIEPAWLSLQPEITCRTLQGDGYGGCMRGRINGMLGEAVKVGGVFTQRFPLFTDSVNGILSDAHAWTNKYVVPHPLTVKQKFEAGGRVFLGLGTAALRGGVF